MPWGFTNFADPASLIVKLRRRRLRVFVEMVENLARPIRVLDVGGIEGFWRVMDVDLERDRHVTLLNISPAPMVSPHHETLLGDARDLSRFADQEFDVVFSSSVIEHLGDLAAQQQMADEIRRVGRYFYIQTPNRYFPIEPHFQFPFFQFMPRRWQTAPLVRWSLGWYPKASDQREASAWVSEIRLMTKRELVALFPHADLKAERLAGLVKSWMAMYGPEQASRGSRNS